MTKTKVIYPSWNPNAPKVTHVAIQSDNNPPYVWCTYSVRSESDLPKLGSDMPIIAIKAAKRLFDFQPGKLEDKVE